MKLSSHSLRSIALCALAAGMLTACWSDDDDDVAAPVTPAPLTDVPSSAAASSTAFTQFVSAQAGATSETAEPLGVANIDVPPTSETDEPVAVL